MNTCDYRYRYLKQCEIYKLCTLIMLAGVVFFSASFSSFLLCLFVFKVNEPRQNINEIKLRKKIDELIVLSPSGYIIYICCNRSLSLTFPVFFSISFFYIVRWSSNECYTAAFPLSPSEIH